MMSDAAPPGLRERKRRETAQRIVDAALRLFIAHGYERATIEAIAEAAGVSRRTVFHYFRSKDEILLSLQTGLGPMIAEALQAELAADRPIDAVRRAFVAISARFPADEMIVLDRIMRSSAAVQARKQASYVQQELALFDALRDRWPEPERALSLRMLAMTAIGAMRLATEQFNREAGRRPLPTLVDEAFAAIDAELGGPG